ncbi:PCYCGC domain-containing protein [Mechercharimyces sp. CAU 1602]|uniref:PCYCGC domain-containing protein n=1 Tax=Mechercharimyces sp. CAU 1602 TaxID=2973933 RepID=UPI0021630202|nr:PCYCGC domain-containing protein [Mechercharimyces sp. CAU 1602]
MMAILSGTSLVGCTDENANNKEEAYSYQSKQQLTFPDFVHTSRIPHASDAYAYAVDHTEELSFIPCYCQCGSIDHKSVRDCFIREHDGDKVTFNEHGSGCGICVDIVLNTKVGLDEGKSLDKVRQEIDDTIGEGKEPTITPYPPKNL